MPPRSAPRATPGRNEKAGCHEAARRIGRFPSAQGTTEIRGSPRPLHRRRSSCRSPLSMCVARSRVILPIQLDVAACGAHDHLPTPRLFYKFGRPLYLCGYRLTCRAARRVPQREQNQKPRNGSLEPLESSAQQPSLARDDALWTASAQRASLATPGGHEVASTACKPVRQRGRKANPTIGLG